MPRHVTIPEHLHDRPFAVDVGRRYGLSQKRMRGRDLETPFRGVRRKVGVRPEFIAQCDSYLPRLAPGHIFSHVTAARLWDMPLPSHVDRDLTLHVSAYRRGTRPRIGGVIGHELSDRRIRVATRHGMPVTDAATTWVQLAAFLTIDDLVAAGDHLVLTPRQPEVAEDPRPFATIAELADRLRRDRGYGHRRAIVAAELLREGSESRRESHLRLNLQRHGLPEPVLQAKILDSAGGFIGYGDIAYPSHKVLVEYDGQQHRTDSQRYHDDVVRHDRLIAEGWVHIRADKHTPSTGPGSAAARAASALRSRGWRR